MGTLVSYLDEVDDPRTGHFIPYQLKEILVIAICAIFAGAESFVEMVEWAQVKEAWLRRFLRLKHGIPSHDTVNRLFRLLDPHQFEAAFRAWTGDVVGAFPQVAVDGKCLRGSGDDTHVPVHMVSAFATDLGLALGQEKVSTKSNEIKAIPPLLAALDLKGCLVSLDAMGCQKEIVRTITEKKADYLVAVKGNQPGLQQAVEAALIDQSGMTCESLQTGHGRSVIQQVTVCAAKGFIDPAEWVGCKTVGRVDSLRVENGTSKPVLEHRYYLSSADLSPEQMAAAIRDHWSIENGLHWSLDVIFREDERLVRKDHAPQNFALLSKMAINLLRSSSDHPKKSLRVRRKRAGWDDDERMRLLGLSPR